MLSEGLSLVGFINHRGLNRLRKRLGRYWFRIVKQQLLNEALTGKSSSVRAPVMRWRRGDLVSDFLLEQFGRTEVRQVGRYKSVASGAPDVVLGLHADLRQVWRCCRVAELGQH